MQYHWTDPRFGAAERVGAVVRCAMDWVLPVLERVHSADGSDAGTANVARRSYTARADYHLLDNGVYLVHHGIARLAALRWPPIDLSPHLEARPSAWEVRLLHPDDSSTSGFG